MDRGQIHPFTQVTNQGDIHRDKIRGSLKGNNLTIKTKLVTIMPNGPKRINNGR